MSDHQTFAFSLPNATNLAIGLLLGKLFDALLAKGVITHRDASGIFERALGEINANSSVPRDQIAIRLIKEFAKRFEENQAE